MLILILAANTSFADFPRLSSLLSRDRYAPRQFAKLGDRLVFSNGILILGGLAALLLIIFRGETHALIPLYAVGVFLSFTLSQSGMIRHWLTKRDPGWRRRLVINGTGAVVTGVVTLVIAATKFTHGAWMVVVLIPVLVMAFKIVIPEFVPRYWWQQVLHNQTALLVKGALLFRRGIVVVNVPFHLRS